MLKVAELLRVKGLVEGEGEKLLNSNFGKNGRPLVTTHLSEPPSSTKLNGGGDHAGHYTPRERSADDRRASSSISEPKESNSSPMRPAFMPGMPQIPMFPLPGMFPNLLSGARDGIHHRNRDHDGGDSSNEREGSPSPGSGSKRRKVASGSGGSSSSKESGQGHREDQQMNMDREGEKGLLHHDLDKDMLPLPPGLDKSALANYVPSQRLEWKRYKQYTRNDIMSAIEEVKNGKLIFKWEIHS